MPTTYISEDIGAATGRELSQVDDTMNSPTKYRIDTSLNYVARVARFRDEPVLDDGGKAMRPKNAFRRVSFVSVPAGGRRYSLQHTQIFGARVSSWFRTFLWWWWPPMSERMNGEGRSFVCILYRPLEQLDRATKVVLLIP